MASGLFTLKQQVQALRQGAWNGQKPNAVEYLVVAGGGAGGANGGGGGAGGLLSGIVPVVIGSATTVTVGGGGAGQSYANRASITGGFNSVFGNITSNGGGQGGTESNSWGGGNGKGANGGSGGGSGFFAAPLSGGSGVLGQGNAGGSNAGTNLNGYGGGGGAGTVGLNSFSTTVGGNGGAGLASVISGTVTAYAGGGGGTGPTISGTGGVGGGGAAGSGGVNGTNGTANTGGGGGGTSGGTSGNGGSGIVIVSYPDTYAAATSTTGSPTVSTSGSGSIAFNGSAALTYPTNSAFAFGTGEFTVEFWVYITSLSTYSWLFDFYTPSGYVGLPFNINFYAPTSKFRYESNSGDRIIGTTTVLVNTWYHVAICRSGSTTRMFVNGSLDGSYTDTYNYVLPTNSQPVIGSRGNYSYNLSGYMSNVRVVKGTALYTSSFTPSTTPLTAVSGTSLLLNTVSGAFAADGSGNGFSATATGTPAWNSASPFATGLGYKNRVYTWTSSGSITF